MEAVATVNVKITASGRDFQSAVKFLKKIGGTFNPKSSTWTIDADYATGDRCVTWGYRIVETGRSAIDMDSEDSIY